MRLKRKGSASRMGSGRVLLYFTHANKPSHSFWIHDANEVATAISGVVPLHFRDVELEGGAKRKDGLLLPIRPPPSFLQSSICSRLTIRSSRTA